MFKSFDPSRVKEAFPVESPWDHQLRGVTQTILALDEVDTVCMCSPTGSGKSIMMIAIISLAIERGLKVVLYTNRRMLTLQTCKNLDKHGVTYGVRAASLRNMYAPNEAVQISSIATEVQRVYHQKIWDLHPADIVLIDEAHMYSSGYACKVIQDHLSKGAKVIGVTATPIGISHIYGKLVVAGKNSEMRACGAHVPAFTKVCHQMDVSKVRRQKTGEYMIGDIRKEVWSQAIVGYVYEDWKRHVPDARQTLGFAPGVDESIYLASQFKAKGVKTAHIDAKQVWIDGEMYNDDDKGTVRQQVMDAWNANDIKVLWNRFVLREGIDCPSIYALLLATPIGSLKSYIQCLGRCLRRSDATPDHVIVCDFAGNYWQHGSCNQDWDWESMFKMSETQIAEARKKKMQSKPEMEPIICAVCQTARNGGPTCPSCGAKPATRTRVVIQHDGKLVETSDPFFKPDVPVERNTAQKNWDNIYWQCKRSGRTFKQAWGMYIRRFGQTPPGGLNNMPFDKVDWARKISEVSYLNLRRADAK